MLSVKVIDISIFNTAAVSTGPHDTAATLLQKYAQQAKVEK